MTDAQHAITLLRKVRQKPGETVQVYAEWLLTLSEDAFPGQQGPAIQRQQIDIFVDGLTEDHMKLNPTTLDAAITCATNEQNLRKRFNLGSRHQYVPNDEDDNRMEVDYYRPPQRCFKCNKIGHRARDCKPNPHVNAVNENRPSNDKEGRKK